MQYFLAALISATGGLAVGMSLAEWQNAYRRRLYSERFVNRWRERLKESEEFLVGVDKTEGADA